VAGASLFAFVIGKVGAARASALVYVVAPIVVFEEWIVFGATPGSSLIVGGAFTLTGLFLVRPRFERETAPSASPRAVTSPREVIVRPARPADIPQLKTLIEQLARYQDLSDRFAATEAGIRAGLFGRHRSAQALVAERGAEIVGYAIFALSFSSTRGERKLVVEDIFVVPDHQGCGVGSALFDDITRRAQELGACYAQWSVLRDNDRAIEFYERMGAQPAPEWITCTLEGDDFDRDNAKSSPSPNRHTRPTLEHASCAS
jgi:GNAT superfamily N-acetyltransferase